MSAIVSADPSSFVRRTIAPISLAPRFATPVLIRALPATSPAGSVSASSAIAPAICAIVTSCFIIERLSTSTIVEPEATPLSVLRVTPAAKSRVTNSSENRASCLIPTGPVITTSVTRSLHNPRLTLGSSASLGNCAATASTAICASSVPRAMSQPGSNSIRIFAEPSDDVAIVFVTPSTPSKDNSTT